MISSSNSLSSLSISTYLQIWILLFSRFCLVAKFCQFTLHLDQFFPFWKISVLSDLGTTSSHAANPTGIVRSHNRTRPSPIVWIGPVVVPVVPELGNRFIFKVNTRIAKEPAAFRHEIHAGTGSLAKKNQTAVVPTWKRNQTVAGLERSSHGSDEFEPNL